MAGIISLIGLNDHIAKADAIVVLGNTVLPNGQPSPRLQARIDCAIDMYHQGVAPLIIVSGGTGVEGYDEAEVMARYLEQHGIPSTSIIRDSSGINTAATANNIAKISHAQHIQSVFIVSQFFHITRTKLAMTHAGLKVNGSTHADYYEARDIYSLARETIGYPAYLLNLR
ncbi:MAG: YdcF family protein [Gammaproteobacteria bacterium]|nr:YdcF family protein [Gammaproteobacteria bacterium]